MTHSIPLGTHVSFLGKADVYEVVDYQDLHYCLPDCDLDHDHFTEPHITVKRSVTLTLPLSRLRYIFNKDGLGRDPTEEEKRGRSDSHKVR